MIVPNGKSRQLFKLSPTAAGVSTKTFILENAAVLVSLFVQSVAGTIDVSIRTFADDSSESVEVITFPQISAPTTDLLLRKAATALANCTVTVTYTGACAFTVSAKGISTGATDARIIGVNEIKTTKLAVGTSALLLISADLTDRQGMGVLNASTSAIVTIAESSAQATAAGWVLFPQQAFFPDVQAGVEIWAISDTADTDVRIIEGGS